MRSETDTHFHFSAVQKRKEKSPNSINKHNRLKHNALKKIWIASGQNNVQHFQHHNYPPVTEEQTFKLNEKTNLNVK